MTMMLNLYLCTVIYEFYKQVSNFKVIWQKAASLIVTPSQLRVDFSSLDPI